MSISISRVRHGLEVERDTLRCLITAIGQLRPNSPSPANDRNATHRSTSQPVERRPAGTRQTRTALAQLLSYCWCLRGVAAGAPHYEVLAIDEASNRAAFLDYLQRHLDGGTSYEMSAD